MLFSLTLGGKYAFADDVSENEGSPTPIAEPTLWGGISPTFVVIGEIPTETAVPPPVTTAPPEPAPPTSVPATAVPTTPPIATENTGIVGIPTTGPGIIPMPTPLEPGPVYLPENSPTPTRVVIVIVVEPTAVPTDTHVPTAIPPTVTPTHASNWFPPGPECSPKPGKIVVKLDVPYIHQVNDVTGADGNWACGPTSVLMALAYYGKIEPWPQYQQERAAIITPKSVKTTKPEITRTPTRTPTSTSTPKRSQATKTPHVSQNARLNYGPYISEPFTYNGHTFSATGPDPRGNPVAGLYGMIAPSGLADWGRISMVLGWYGLTARQVSPTWDGVTAALKRGHPVLIGNDLTAAGHILLAVGYTANNHLIVNDPYGNRFTWGYGANDGESVYYPWSCSRVRNAVEVVGVYTPPATSTAAPATVAEALPERGEGSGSAFESDGGAGPGSRYDGYLAFAAQVLPPVPHGRFVPTGDISASASQAVAGKHMKSQSGAQAQTKAPVSLVLLADRATTGPAYWWLTLPTLLALTGFLVVLGEWRSRKRTARTKANAHPLPQ